MPGNHSGSCHLAWTVHVPAGVKELFELAPRAGGEREVVAFYEDDFMSGQQLCVCGLGRDGVDAGSVGWFLNASENF